VENAGEEFEVPRTPAKESNDATKVEDEMPTAAKMMF